MPSSRLNLYRFIEDAWSGGLRAWCERTRDFEGESWLLVGNAGQTRWLLRKFANAGIDGIRILDPDGLRNELSSLAPTPRLCCVGWDAARWPDLDLLALAAAKAHTCDLFVPSPRLPADAQQGDWIEALEQRLGLKRVICPESGFASENEPLVSRLEKSGLASRSEARAPLLLVGREWPDQVRLVCEQVVAWAPETREAEWPIGIISPDNSATAIAVAEALEKAGVRVEHPGRIREKSGKLLIVEQVARYHLSGHDVRELIELANLLWLYAPEEWNALEPENIRDLMTRAFRYAQSRNARILARALPWRKDAAWVAVCGVVEGLGRWDGDFSPAELRGKWTALLDALHLPDALAVPDGLFDQERVTGRAFMEWVADQPRPEVPPPDYAMLAPVVVTGFAGAAQQTWERLIFLDSNENVWPAPDSRPLDQARFLDLLEHCRGPIAFAGVLLEQTEAGDYAQPNDWVLRALIETGQDPDLWAASARACPPAPPLALDEAERAHIQRVDSSRRNPTIPFDRYMFNFHETKLEPGAWSATDLDEALTCPATFALRELFGVAAPEPLIRAEGAAVGNRAHRWLGRILGLTDRLALAGGSAGDEAGLAREMAAARRELAEWYGEDGLPMPLWWETCLRKTEWTVRRCLREVRGWLEGHYCAAEQSLAVTVQTSAGPLMLKGRLDILISDRPEIAGAQAHIFDFKTGRGAAPAQNTQFAAYYLMARDAGAAEVVVGVIKPHERAHDIYSKAHEVELRAHFGAFASLSRNLRFGRRGPLISDYGPFEKLPMATIPIDPAILEQKAGLFLLAQ